MPVCAFTNGPGAGGFVFWGGVEGLAVLRRPRREKPGMVGEDQKLRWQGRGEAEMRLKGKALRGGRIGYCLCAEGGCVFPVPVFLISARSTKGGGGEHKGGLDEPDSGRSSGTVGTAGRLVDVGMEAACSGSGYRAGAGETGGRLVGMRKTSLWVRWAVVACELVSR